MKKLIKKVELPEEVVTSIEYSFFFKEADNEILENIVTKKSGYDYDKDMFDYFYNRFQKNRMVFEMKIKEAAIEYAGKESLKKDSNIEVDFMERTLCIYEEKNDRRISKSNCKNNK